MEPKAIASAKPFSERINTEVRAVTGLRELDRSTPYAESRAKYNQMVREALETDALFSLQIYGLRSINR